MSTSEESTPTSTESTTSNIPESSESMIESTTESPIATTETAIDSSTSEQSSKATTEAAASTESAMSTTESQEQSTESQEQSTTEESQEQSTTESKEPSTTETQEQSTTELQEQSTTESQEQTTTESSESTTAEQGAPCSVGNLTDDQIILVCPTGFRRHPKHCNLFYQCSSEDNMEIKILVLSCPENTIFDEKKIQCVPESESSQPCMGTKTSARFYRRLEDHALSPVSIFNNQLNRLITKIFIAKCFFNFR